MDGGGSRLSEAEDDDDVAVFVDGQWVKAGGDKSSPIDVEDVLFTSTPPSPSASDCSPINCNKKRKEVVSSKVPAKKRHLDNNKVASCPVRRDNDLVENSSNDLTEGEIAHLFETANISSNDYEFLVPSKDQRANKPPDGYISVYEKQIGRGLRFPLHDLVIDVCNLIDVCPSQLVPNAYRMIVGFILCAKLYQFPVTADYFFSLFKPCSAHVKNLFYFKPLTGKHFLKDKPASSGPWKRKFFFLRPRGKSWSCLTKWSKKYLKPSCDAALAESTVILGIMDHQFYVNKLICKELLVHGGVEPGVPSPELTFRYLMHKAAVTKFQLLPEDCPPVPGTTGADKTPSKAPLSSLSSAFYVTPTTIPSMRKSSPGQPPRTSPTSTYGTASPAQLNSEHPVNCRQSHPRDAEIPSHAEVPICEDFLAYSKDSIPLKEFFRKGYEDRTSKYFESHVEVNYAVPVADHQDGPQDLPTNFLTMSQVLDSMFVPKECYQKLELEREELFSELTFTKCRVQELEQELKLCKAKRADSDSRASLAMESVKILVKAVENLKLESGQLHVKIKKDAIESFKSCRSQLLNLGKLPKGFDFDFLDVAVDEWGKSAEQEHDGSTATARKKSIKPET